MTAWSHTFNGYTSGTTITTANSAAGGGTAFNAVSGEASGFTIRAQSTAAFEGANGMQLVFPSGTSVGGYAQWGPSAPVGTRLSGSFWFRFAAASTATGQGDSFALLANGLNQLRLSGTAIQATDGTGVVLTTSSSTTTGTWLFVQHAVTAGATTTSGRVECKITTAAGATLLSYDSGAAVNVGTSTITVTRYGRSSGGTQGNTWSYDLLNLTDTLTSGFPGAVAPVAAGGNIKVYTGSGFVAKPVKVWTGTAWVVKPVKRWNGTAWVLTTS